MQKADLRDIPYSHKDNKSKYINILFKLQDSKLLSSILNKVKTCHTLPAFKRCN